MGTITTLIKHLSSKHNKSYKKYLKSRYERSKTNLMQQTVTETYSKKLKLETILS
jgi:ribosomal protein S17E